MTTAIKKAEEELGKGGQLYCLGDIVHNGMEVERLHHAGLITINHEDMEKLHHVKVFLRLLGVPLVIVLLLWAVHASLWIPDGKSILMTVYLSAITPACATVTSMAQLYDRDASHSSAIYVLSTLLSILTMPLMIGSFELLL